MHFLIRRIHLLDPCGKSIVSRSADNNIAVRRYIVLRGIYPAHIGVAAVVLYCVVDNAVWPVRVIVVRDVEIHTAIVSQGRIGVWISIIIQQQHTVCGHLKVQRS